ncbi:hypothetical protein Sango_2738300 [Sesamum angolense]|uniref:Uncharacterized protein n=1 Tax=Sesamum angolense TaxID=2727404 RepID=A0AAE1T8R6_9LAMI|nr:hypothetical protein Sango_2738300 [Sesamum angolense]
MPRSDSRRCRSPNPLGDVARALTGAASPSLVVAGGGGEGVAGGGAGREEQWGWGRGWQKKNIRIKHDAVKELLKTRIISLDYVRSKRNLADPLTNGLTRRIILKTSRAMGLKPLE